MSKRFVWLPLGVGVVLAASFLAIGCGGDDKPDSSASRASPTAARSGTATSGGSGSASVRAGLSELNAYKCSLKIEGSGGPLAELESLFSPNGNSTSSGPVALEGSVTYIKPDKSQMTVKIGAESFGQTTIGRQQWSTLGGLTVGPNAVGPQTASDLSLCASFWDEGFASNASAFQCAGGRESVNGQQTRKCSIDRSTFDQVKQFLGGVLSDPDSDIRDLSRFQMELWVTEGTNSIPTGLPVRFRADMAGKDGGNRDFQMKIELDVTNINDSGLSVAAPR